MIIIVLNFVILRLKQLLMQALNKTVKKHFFKNIFSL